MRHAPTRLQTPTDGAIGINTGVVTLGHQRGHQHRSTQATGFAPMTALSFLVGMEFHHTRCAVTSEHVAIGLGGLPAVATFGCATRVDAGAPMGLHSGMIA